MNLLELSLISSAFLCSLITGFILIFAIVVMPGISRFEDKEFLKAFQLIDGIIQNNQPISVSYTHLTLPTIYSV